MDKGANKKLKSRAVWMLFCFLSLFIPLAEWWNNLGGIVFYLDGSVPSGQIFYVLSKLFGLLAFSLLTLQLLTGLAQQSLLSSNYPFLQLRPETHRTLGVLSMVLITAHIAMFTTAVYLRTSSFPLQLFIPNFTHGYYKNALSLGLIGFVILWFVITAGVFLRRNKTKIMIIIHRFSILSYSLVFFHMMMIGTESQSGVLLIYYYLMLLLVVVFGCYGLLGMISRAVRQKATVKTI